MNIEQLNKAIEIEYTLVGAYNLRMATETPAERRQTHELVNSAYLRIEAFAERIKRMTETQAKK